MKGKHGIKILVLMMVSMALWASSPTISIAQESEYAATLSARNLTLDDFARFKQEIYDQVIQTNLGYLSIAVAIIGIAGAAVFLFLQFVVLQPQKKELISQKEEIARQKNELKAAESKLYEEINKHSAAQQLSIRQVEKDTKDEMRQLFVQAEQRLASMEVNARKIAETSSAAQTEINGFLARLKKLEHEHQASIKMLTRDIQHQEIIREWQGHYLWEVKGITVNVVRSLMTSLNKDVKYGLNYLIDLVLAKLSDVIPKMTDKEFASTKSDIEAGIAKVQGHETEIQRVRTALAKMETKQ